MKLYAKWNTDEGTLFRKTYSGQRVAVAYLFRKPGSYSAYIGEKQFSSSTMKALKEEVTAHLNAEANELVTVKNLMSGKDVQIRRGDLGGVTDSSTERYWSM